MRFLATVRDGRWCVVDSQSDNWIVAIATGDEEHDMEWAVNHAKDLSESYAAIDTRKD